MAVQEQKSPSTSIFSPGLKTKLAHISYAYFIFFGIIFFLGLYIENYISSKNPVTIQVGEYQAVLSRDPAQSGVPFIEGETHNDVAMGLGYMHAHDRGIQIFLQRFVAQGRLSEILGATDETLRVDKYIRQYGFSRSLKSTIKALEADDLKYLEAYVSGINHFYEHNRRPLELYLLGYNPLDEPFTVEDVLLIGKLMPFLGLTDIQGSLEKFIIELMGNDNGLKFAKSLMRPYLDEVDEEIVDLVRKVKIRDTTIPGTVLQIIGSISASNNWAVSGKLSASGKPVLVSDPHMRIDSLPAVWYECVLKTKDNYLMGISTPGTPLVVMGRNKKTAYSFTFGTGDTYDYIITECRRNKHGKMECKVEEPNIYEEVQEYIELIKRKGKSSDIEYKVRELSHSNCILEAPQQMDDGYYLCHAYVAQKEGAARSVTAFRKAYDANTVKELQQLLRHADISMNMVLTDIDGNIGYQQCGYYPLRAHSGLFPFPAWDKRYQWKGIVNPDDLVSYTNPDNGWIATANNNINPTNSMIIVNADLGNYRLNRIEEMLMEHEGKFYQSDMMEMLMDVKSKQAEQFMQILRSEIPRHSSMLNEFAEWDGTFDRENINPTIYDEFMKELHAEVYKRIFTAEQYEVLLTKWRHFFHFDRFILDYSERDNWVWKGETQKELFSKVFQRVWNRLENTRIEKWGSRNTLTLKNMFWSKVLPSPIRKALGIDVSFQMNGSRNTVSPMISMGPFSAGVSWRMIADMGFGYISTNLPGGVTARVLTRYYVSDLFQWFRGQFKTLSPV